MTRRRIVMLTLVVLTAGRAAAHPHIWIDRSIRLLADALGLRAIEVTWVFDDFNSADMVSLFDENDDGRISASDSDRFRFRMGWRDVHGLVICFFDQTYCTDFKIEPVHPSHAWAGRSAVLRPVTTLLASQGWGTIPVPGLRVDFE